MKKVILLFLFTTFGLLVRAQHELRSDTLHLDLDRDLKKDSVIFDKSNGVIVVKLSSQKFKAMSSQQVEFDNVSSGINPTKSGFEFANNWMRAGYACQFRYNPTVKKVQLIGMSRYEFGPASNDGSGKSSVNLLTNDYIGNWNHWIEEPGKLIALKTIKQKMFLPTTFLADFNDDQINQFQEKCVALYLKAKAQIKKTVN